MPTRKAVYRVSVETRSASCYVCQTVFGVIFFFNSMFMDKGCGPERNSTGVIKKKNKRYLYICLNTDLRNLV